MINLILNEFKKVFKRKSIYILFAVMLVFVILNTFLINVDNNTIYVDTRYSEHLKEETDSVDVKSLTNIKDKELYAYGLADYNAAKMSDKYGYDSWEYNLTNNLYMDYYNYYYMLTFDSNNELFKDLESKINEYNRNIEDGNYKYFVIKELNDAIKEKEELLKENNVNSNNIDNVNQRIYLNQTILDKDIIPEFDDYRYRALTMINSNFKSLDETIAEMNYSNKDFDLHIVKMDYYSALKDNEINKYVVENNVDVDNQSYLSYSLASIFNNYFIFIIVIGIMIAGSIVSSEFNKGTIKYLLIRPYKRWSILLSKFIVSFLVMLLSIVVLVIMQYVVGGLVLGFDTINVPFVIFDYSIGKVVEMNVFKYILITTIELLPELILLMTLAFALSTIVVSSAVSIVVPLLGFVGSSVINSFAPYYNLWWLKYFVTVNWDFTIFSNGAYPVYRGISFTSSIIVCICYFLIMIIPTFIVFIKKNIKNI